jgi:hypothetical protein
MIGAIILITAMAIFLDRLHRGITMIPIYPYFSYLMLMFLLAWHGVPPEIVITTVYNDEYALANRLSYGYLWEKFRGRA